MKMKILAGLTLLLSGMAGGTLAKADDYTMIVAPARYSVMQVAFDVLNKRSAVLVSYQQDGDSPLLHVWNGSVWTEIGVHDLSELSFVQKTPTRAVLIGDDDLLPESIRRAMASVPEVVVVRQIENANLLNEFGRIMKWSGNEWAWFAARYGLELEDEASGIRNTSWYDQPGPIIKQDQPVYQPVPVVDERDTINPSSTRLPSPDASMRPSDLPESQAMEMETEEASDDDADPEIQKIVDALEETQP